jgi:hypothetical protein
MELPLVEKGFRTHGYDESHRAHVSRWASNPIRLVIQQVGHEFPAIDGWDSEVNSMHRLKLASLVCMKRGLDLLVYTVDFLCLFFEEALKELCLPEEVSDG